MLIMPHYVVTAPCSYTENDEAFVHTRAGGIVELCEATAGELGDVVQKLNQGPEDAEQVHVAAGPGDGRRRSGRPHAGEKPKTGEPGDGELTTTTPTGEGDLNPEGTPSES